MTASHYSPLEERKYLISYFLLSVWRYCQILCELIITRADLILVKIGSRSESQQISKSVKKLTHIFLWIIFKFHNNILLIWTWSSLLGLRDNLHLKKPRQKTHRVISYERVWGELYSTFLVSSIQYPNDITMTNDAIKGWCHRIAIKHH